MTFLMKVRGDKNCVLQSLNLLLIYVRLQIKQIWYLRQQCQRGCYLINAFTLFSSTPGCPEKTWPDRNWLSIDQSWVFVLSCLVFVFAFWGRIMSWLFMWRSENNFLKLVLISHRMDSGLCSASLPCWVSHRPQDLCPFQQAQILAHRKNSGISAALRHHHMMAVHLFYGWY